MKRQLNRTNRIFIPFFLLLIFLFSTTAYAHRVSIFAYVEGDKVFTESYFSKKKRVHQGKVEVFNLADEKLLLTGLTDDDGNFVFPIPEEIKAHKSGLKLVLHASEGHRGEWTIAAEEIFPNSDEKNVSNKSSSPEKIKTPQVYQQSEMTDLRQDIKELNTKLDTIKRMLINQQEDGPGVHEIFSGIGYIFGLFGVAAFFASRKK